MNSNTENKNNTIAKNTIILYIRTFVLLIVSLYSSRVILENLGVSDFGVYNVVAGLVAMLELLLSSLTSAVQRYYNYENAKKGNAGLKQVYACTFCIQIFISLFFIAIIETAGYWYLLNKMVIPDGRLEAAKLLFHTSSGVLFLQILQVPYISLIIAKERMSVYVLYGIFESVLKLFLIILIPFWGEDHLIVYAYLLLLLASISFIFYFAYTKIKYKGIIKLCRPDFSLLTEMFKFVFWSSVNGFANMGKNQGVNMILNYFFGTVVNAARGVSYQIKSALVQFISNISVAARPQLVESYTNGNIQRAKNIMFSISRVSFYAIYILAYPIIIERNFILSVWLGSNVPDHTSNFVLWVLLITLVDILCTPLNMLIYAHGDIKGYNITYSIISLLIIPFSIITFNIATMPELVYIESFALSVILLFISLLFVARLTPVKTIEYCKYVCIPLIKVVGLSLLVTLIMNLVPNSGWPHFLIVAPISFISVCIIIYLVGLSDNERIKCKVYIRKFYRRHE